MDESRVRAAQDFLVKQKGMSPEAAAETILRVMGGTPPEPPATGFRADFARLMGNVAEGPERFIEAIASVGPGREQVVPGGPTTGRMVGQAVGSLIPRTPEGAVLSMLPWIRGAAPLIATGPRAMASLPLVGAGTAYMTGLPQHLKESGFPGGLVPGGETAAGALQGLLAGGSIAATRGVQRVTRRFTGREPSVRNIERKAGEQVDMADLFTKGVEKDSGISLRGRTPAEKLIKGPEHVQEIISTDYQGMQTAVEKGLKGQTINLPFLAQIRGKTVTIPGTPAVPPTGLVGPGGQPVSQGTPGTPARTTLDTKFTAKEALDALKEFGSYVRKASFTAGGEPKGGEPMTGRQLREFNRTVRAELQDALVNTGRVDLAQEFRRASDFYARGLQTKELLEGVKASTAVKGGATTEGGLDEQALRDLLISGKIVEPQDFPASFAAAHRGQTLGARELQRPGAQPIRAYIPTIGTATPVLPATRLPIGTPMQVSGLPSKIAGTATALGVEGLLKDIPQSSPARQAEEAKKILPLIAPSVGVE